MIENPHQYRLEKHTLYSHFPFHVQMARHDMDFHTHGHDFSEIILVLSGEALHRIAGNRYRISKGDVFVIHPGLNHGFTGTKDLRLLNMMFSLDHPVFNIEFLKNLPGYHHLFTLDPLLRESGAYNSGLSLHPESADQVTLLAYKILEEYTRAEEGFEGMITSYFQELIITLSRKKAVATRQSHNGTLPIARAMAYIQKNYAREIHSEDLAIAAKIGIRQLSRLFRNILDLTPSEYLCDIRLLEARKHLKCDELSITEVSECCGFSDGNYFSRVFSRRYGISPREFRKKALESPLKAVQ